MKRPTCRSLVRNLVRWKYPNGPGKPAVRVTPDYIGRALRICEKLAAGQPVDPESSDVRGLRKILRDRKVPPQRAHTIRHVLAMVDEQGR